MEIHNLEGIARELLLRGEMAKRIEKEFPKDMNEELKDILINQRIDEEIEVWEYTHR